MLVVEAAVAKTSKYAVSESGDTVELVERPRGGLSLVMADGQRSGLAAKAISNAVARKAATLLAEGVRDGAAARAASDYLLSLRRGQVSADLVVISADLDTHTLVVTRNIGCPVLLCHDGELRTLDAAAPTLGTSRTTRPQITEIPLTPGLAVIAFTDGVWEAGSQSLTPTTVPDWMAEIACEHAGEPQLAVDLLLDRAVTLDHGRPRDDMTVVALATAQHEESADVRRMHVVFPIRQQ
ncbi:MAG: PP2C family protein-serine/threonine phosphatase [Anaerolineae bacterium]